MTVYRSPKLHAKNNEICRGANHKSLNNICNDLVLFNLFSFCHSCAWGFWHSAFWAGLGCKRQCLLTWLNKVNEWIHFEMIVEKKHFKKKCNTGLEGKLLYSTERSIKILMDGWMKWSHAVWRKAEGASSVEVKAWRCLYLFFCRAVKFFLKAGLIWLNSSTSEWLRKLGLAGLGLKV